MISESEYYDARRNHWAAQRDQNKKLDEIAELLADANWATENICHISWKVDEEGHDVTAEEHTEVLELVDDLIKLTDHVDKLKQFAAEYRHVVTWEQAMTPEQREFHEAVAEPARRERDRKIKEAAAENMAHAMEIHRKRREAEAEEALRPLRAARKAATEAGHI
jgi:hypothetical protein